MRSSHGTSTWARLRTTAGTLGDVLATPRGAAPGRAVRNAATRREHM